MPFSVTLIVVAASCQLILTIMGAIFSVRQPEKENQIAAVLFLGLVGAVGCGAVIWSGIRSDKDQANMSTGIIAIKTDVHSLLTARKEPTKMTSPPAAPATAAPSLPPSQPKAHARIVIPSIAAAPLSTTPPGYAINVFMKNNGAIPGTAPQMTYSFSLVDREYSLEEIDKEISGNLALAIKTGVGSSNAVDQLEVGEPKYVSLNKGLTTDAYDKIKSGAQKFYLFAVLAYTDENLPKGQYWITEFCGEPSADFSVIRICRNRVYLHKG